MGKELKDPSQSESGRNNQTPKSRATTLYSDDEEFEPEASGSDDESDSEIDESREDDGFEVDEDIDTNAAVLQSIINGKTPVQYEDSKTSVPSSLAVEDDEDFNWNAV